ncbi:ImpA family metalloprotease [Thalassotalea maritima]|uniref:ImpA family metalloprotease n=1 Tax=Thalassotalea maritima TaxID=3242416 RepID=UPI003527BE16
MLFRHSFFIITLFLLSACGGSDPNDSNVVIEQSNSLPILTGTASDAIAEQQYSYTPVISDADDDAVTFSTNEMPSWLAIDGDSISGIPTEQDVGLVSFSIILSDGKGENSFTVSFEVKPKPNQLPTLMTAVVEARVDEAFAVTLLASDADGDSVSFTLANTSDWLTLDTSTGQLSGLPRKEHQGTQLITIELSDGKQTQQQQIAITVEPSWLDVAISTGNALVVKASETILDAAIHEVEQIDERHKDIKRQLFKFDSDDALTSIDWQPTHDAAMYGSDFLFNDAVLYTNNNETKRAIAIAGSKQENIGRYLVLGGNPFRNDINEQMQQFLVNAFDWLSQKNTKSLAQFDVVLAQLDESYYFKDRSKTRAWLDSNYDNVNYNDVGSCDGQALAGCIAEKPDVIIVSRKLYTDNHSSDVIAAIEQALADDIPVVYIQLDGGIGEHGRALLNVFNVKHAHDNYWSRDSLQGFNPNTFNSEELIKLSALANLKRLLNNFANHSFDVDLSGCETRSCPQQSNTQLQFFAAANVVKTLFNDFDKRKLNIFTTDTYRLPKLLILLADHYRQSVSYPMDKITSDTVMFFKSLYADYAVYNVRSVNPIQPDMGNFSRSDFSHVSPETKTVTLISKPSFKSAGVYAIPGQTFKVTRNDSESVATSIFINTLRTGATHIFNNNGYNRPYHLWSQQVRVEPGETIEFTSSYGGPIQVAFDVKDIEVSLTFEYIGRHPHWRSPADDADFAERMQRGDYDWAEIATAGFEVHSKHSKMQASLDASKELWPNASDFANATSRYTHNMVHMLAGFQGPGIDQVAEIHDFAKQRGLLIDTIDIVKHMNADQPTCGWGCSGNPYDAGWNFSPTGHGDLHELGHGIERSSMRFEGYGFHSNTNFYSYFAKSVYEDDTGQNASCQALPFEATFNVLKQSKLQADPIAYVQQNLSKSWSEHHAIYVQLMMAAQANNKVSNGWYIYPRLHIWEREFYRADDSEQSWLEKREALGFGLYSYDELTAITRNEWLYISLSEIMQMDLVDWFAMYGFVVSDKAKAQVQSKGYQRLAQVFYAANGADFCSSLEQPAVLVDGESTWPDSP